MFNTIKTCHNSFGFERIWMGLPYSLPLWVKMLWQKCQSNTALRDLNMSVSYIKVLAIYFGPFLSYSTQNVLHNLILNFYLNWRTRKEPSQKTYFLKKIDMPIIFHLPSWRAIKPLCRLCYVSFCAQIFLLDFT